MTGPRTTRRAAADRLAALLEGGPADDADEGAVATVDADEQAMLLLASALREAAPLVEPMRAEFRAELRARVVDAAREQRAEPALLTRVRDRIHRWRYSTGVVTGSSVAAMALSGGGVAAAAEGAQPGELLYPVKTGIEDVRLALSGGDLTGGHRAVTYSFDRMVEAAHAARAGDDAAAAIALDGAADRMAEGTERLVATGLLEPLLSLADAVNAQEAQLEQLLPLLGAEGSVAANGLFDVLAHSRNAIGTAVVPSGGTPDIEGPPALPLPDQSATPTPTPTPTIPPGDADDALEVPEAGTDSPLLPLPGVPLPDPGVPTEPLPLPLPPPPPGGTGDVLDGVEDAVQAVGGTVDDVIEEGGQGIEDTVDAVSEPIEEVLPAPVQSAVESTVEDLGGGAGETVDDVGDTLGTVDDAVQGIEDVTSGTLGGG